MPFGASLGAAPAGCAAGKRCALTTSGIAVAVTEPASKDELAAAARSRSLLQHELSPASPWPVFAWAGMVPWCACDRAAPEAWLP